MPLYDAFALIFSLENCTWHSRSNKLQETKLKAQFSRLFLVLNDESSVLWCQAVDVASLQLSVPASSKFKTVGDCLPVWVQNSFSLPA